MRIFAIRFWGSALKFLFHKRNTKKDVQGLIKWSQVAVEIRSKKTAKYTKRLTEKKNSEKKSIPFKLKIMFVF